MNPKLQGLVENFAKEKGIKGDLPYQYEHFVDNIIFREEFYRFNSKYPSGLDKGFLESINFGRNSTEAVDGFFCIIENSLDSIHIDSSVEEIEQCFSNNNNRFVINIVLIQTKKGDLETSSLNSLGVILQERYEGQQNWETFFQFRNNLNTIIRKNANKKEFEIYFTAIYCVGNNINEELFNQDSFQLKENFLKKSMADCFWIDGDDTKKITISYYDGKKILKTYENQNKTLNQVTKTVEIKSYTLPESCGEFADLRLGLITIGEYKKIIFDFEISRPYLLYDYNVRHDIGRTPINDKIKNTILNTNDNLLFPLYNNGVTIVVDNIKRSGGENSFELKNIRVVNGCQTSHAILNTSIQTDEFDNIVLPIKIIAIKNENDPLLSSITYSSNNQNPIDTQNLISLEKNIVLLEKAYKEYNIVNNTNYLFERRQGQYSNSNRNFVIDIYEQAQIFMAVWFQKPHIPLMYKDLTLTDFRNNISSLNDDDQNTFFEICILPAISWCKVYTYILNDFETFEPARFHILTSIIYKNLKDLFIECSTKSDKEKIPILIQNHSLIKEKITELNKKEIFEDNFIEVCSIIDNMDSITKNTNGRYHYRKFYPADVIKNIYQEIK